MPLNTYSYSVADHKPLMTDDMRRTMANRAHKAHQASAISDCEVDRLAVTEGLSVECVHTGRCDVGPPSSCHPARFVT